jgi:hypothetical protein
MARVGCVKDLSGRKIKYKSNKSLENVYKKSHPKNEFASTISTSNTYNLMTSEAL